MKRPGRRTTLELAMACLGVVGLLFGSIISGLVVAEIRAFMGTNIFESPERILAPHYNPDGTWHNEYNVQIQEHITFSD